MDTEADPDRLIGRVLAGRYCVEALLGKGAMGTVYRARHVKVGRTFAVKVMHPRLLGDDKMRRRFDREAALAGSLHHPNVLSVVDVGDTIEGLRYLVMEFAEGTTLFERMLESGPMPAHRIIMIVRQLLAGLGHAHDRGLIHRDFKPENVIVERQGDIDIPRIADFGVAILRDDLAASGAARLTSSGFVLGTPLYMAPEHATGAPIDHRIDLFALGVMCFEMLAGCPPFDGSGVDVARANLLRETPVIAVRVPGLRVDPLLEAFTRRLMMKSRDARPANARAAGELLALIDRDPAAAAALLGVTIQPARVAWLMDAPHAVPSAPGMSAEATWPLEGGPPPRAPAGDEPEPWRYQRMIAALVGLSLVGALVIALLAGHAAPTAALLAPPASAIAPAPVPRLAPEPPAAATDSPPATAPLALLNPSMNPAPRAADASPSVTPPRSSLARKASATSLLAARMPSAPREGPPPELLSDIRVRPKSPAASIAAPTMNGVAQLYSSVGRKLKSLDQARGSAATADLWPLYLRIRINDVIADPVKRIEASALLNDLHDTIGIRSLD